MLSKPQSMTVLSLGLLCLILQWGCGGGSSSGGSAGPGGGGTTTKLGTVSVAIAWPDRTRATALPLSAASVKITTDVADGPVATADRVGDAAYTQTLTLTKLPVGSHDITISAFTMAGSQGSLTATGHAMVNVKSGVTSTTETTLVGKVAKVTVMPATVAVGQTVQLAASATDDQGAVLLLGAGAMRFALVNTSSSLTLTLDGKATGVSDDDVAVVATLDGVTSEPVLVSVRSPLPAGVEVLEIPTNPYDTSFAGLHYNDALSVITTSKSIWTEVAGWRQAPSVRVNSNNLQGTITCVSRDGFYIGGTAGVRGFTGFSADLTTVVIPYGKATSPSPDRWTTSYTVWPNTIEGSTFFAGMAYNFPEEGSDHMFSTLQKVVGSGSEFTAFHDLIPYISANGQYAGVDSFGRPALSSAVSTDSLIDNVFVGQTVGMPTGLSANADLMVGWSGLVTNRHPFVLDQNGYHELGVSGSFVGCTAENHMGAGHIDVFTPPFQQGCFLWLQDLGVLDPTNLIRALARQRKWDTNGNPTTDLFAVGYTGTTDTNGGAIRFLLLVAPPGSDKSFVVRVQVPRTVLQTLPVVK